MNSILYTIYRVKFGPLLHLTFEKQKGGYVVRSESPPKSQFKIHMILYNMIYTPQSKYGDHLESSTSNMTFENLCSVQYSG